MISVHLAVLITIAHHIEVSSEKESGARPKKNTSNDDHDEDQSDGDQNDNDGD